MTRESEEHYDSLSKQVLELAETSYVRGLPRVVDRTKPTAVRVTWGLAILLCSALLALHSVNLYASYLQFDYTTALKQQRTTATTGPVTNSASN